MGNCSDRRFRFEPYALALLKEEATVLGKPMLIGPEAGPAGGFDAAAADGFGDLPGPTGIEVKSSLNGMSARWVSSLLARAAGGEFKSVLVVVEDGTPAQVQRLLPLFKKVNPQVEVAIWLPSDLEQLAERYPGVAVAFRPDYLPQAVESFARGLSDHSGQNHLDALKKAFREDSLVLFLGAGVSVTAGLPDWDTLLWRLGSQLIHLHARPDQVPVNEENLLKLLKEQTPLSPLIAARFFRESFDDFAERVRTALYEGMPKEVASPLLTELMKLCIPPQGGLGVAAVVTYNFDDLFEEELTRRGVRHKVVMSDTDSHLRNELPVYHVHGFLPRKGSLSDVHQQSLVFSEEAFHLQFIDPYAWQTVTQLNLLRDRVCLFIGFSMTDPNQRRLLEIAASKRPGARHYVVMKDHWQSAVQSAGSEDVLAYARIFRGLEEASLLKLGLQSIWVEDFDDIPLLVRSLRQVIGSMDVTPGPAGPR
ncbi:MAG TPA: SIR2 family protein [Symbiobacteriaceae bacterium]|jgi:hypothetical protein